jgi:hypothetical protein
MEDWIFWTLLIGSIVSGGIAEVLYEIKSLKKLINENDESRK